MSRLRNGTLVAVPASPTSDNDQFTFVSIKKLTANQQFSAYYYFDERRQHGAILHFPGRRRETFPVSERIFVTRVQQWNLSHTWTIDSTAVNEFRFNYFREGQQTITTR